MPLLIRNISHKPAKREKRRAKVPKDVAWFMEALKKYDAAAAALTDEEKAERTLGRVNKRKAEAARKRKFIKDAGINLLFDGCKIFREIEDEYLWMMKNAAEQYIKGSKKSGSKARKSMTRLARLLKEFRKDSFKQSKLGFPWSPEQDDFI